MSENIEKLTDEEVAKAQGGFDDDGPSWTTFSNKDGRVECPKCKSTSLYYVPGLFWITEFNRYLCKNCGHDFRDFDLPGGESGDW